MKKMDNLHLEQGVSIVVNGRLVIGIHPDNVENNLQALADGKLSIDWNNILKQWKETKQSETSANEHNGITYSAKAFEGAVYNLAPEVDFNKVAEVLSKELLRKQKSEMRAKGFRM